MTARARIVRDSPVRVSVSTAPVPVGSLTRTRVCTLGALGDGGAGDGEHQAYVVLELPVPGEQSAAQPVAVVRRRRA